MTVMLVWGVGHGSGVLSSTVDMLGMSVAQGGFGWEWVGGLD